MIRVNRAALFSFDIHHKLATPLSVSSVLQNSDNHPVRSYPAPLAQDAEVKTADASHHAQDAPPGHTDVHR